MRKLQIGDVVLVRESHDTPTFGRYLSRLIVDVSLEGKYVCTVRTQIADDRVKKWVSVNDDVVDVLAGPT